MFKRRDWTDLHGTEEGQDEAEDSASSSDEEVSEAEQSDLEDQNQAGLNEASTGRLEDLSEDDFDEAGSSDPEGDRGASEDESDGSAELEALLRDWLSADDPTKLKGEALTCRLCSDVLILNAVNLRQHLQSKRHKKALKQLPESAVLLDQICLAGDVSDPEEEGETFTERLDRLRKLDAQPSAAIEAGAAAVPASNRSRKRLRKQKAASAVIKATQPSKRLGKRQRQALKDQKLIQQAQPASPNGKAQPSAASGPIRKQRKQNRMSA
ncbi:hypothetical protein WJX74_006519 [Apatococcus lobatus]|uniref:Uncharacterized protein n=1 Tax=Apatococcus lobatus TaxID=904363 RepID=A0AAW1QYI9_9CHLO